MTVGKGASTHRVLDILGIVVAVLEGAAGIALLSMSRHYGSTNGGYVIAAMLLLAVAGLTGLPVGVYRNGVLKALGAMSGALIVLGAMCGALIMGIGVCGLLTAFAYWQELSEHFIAPSLLLAGSLVVCLAGAIPFMKSARGRGDW